MRGLAGKSEERYGVSALRSEAAFECCSAKQSVPMQPCLGELIKAISDS
jgi:hypothetical protein